METKPLREIMAEKNTGDELTQKDLADIEAALSDEETEGLESNEAKLSKLGDLDIEVQESQRAEIVTTFREFISEIPSEESFVKAVDGLVLFPEILYGMFKLLYEKIEGLNAYSQMLEKEILILKDSSKE